MDNMLALTFISAFGEQIEYLDDDEVLAMYKMNRYSLQRVIDYIRGVLIDHGTLHMGEEN